MLYSMKATLVGSSRCKYVCVYLKGCRALLVSHHQYDYLMSITENGEYYNYKVDGTRGTVHNTNKIHKHEGIAMQMNFK